MKATDILLKVGEKSLLPCEGRGWEVFERLTYGDEIIATIMKPRHPEQHKRFWALAGAVANFDKEFVDAEDAVNWVKEQIPNMHTKKWSMLPDGTVVLVKILKSISYASMDQVKFGRFYDRSLWLWSERIGCDPDALLAESRGEKLWIERAVEERRMEGELGNGKCQEGQTRNG